MLTPEKIARLREAAQAAPPGPWHVEPTRNWEFTPVQAGAYRQHMPEDMARFVAAADPTTVLELVHIVETLTGGWWPMAPHIAPASEDQQRA